MAFVVFFIQHMTVAVEWPAQKTHQSQVPLSSWHGRHHRTRQPVEAAFSPSCSEWHFDKFFFFEKNVVRLFTADSNLLQPTGGDNSTPHACSHLNVTSTLAQVWRAAHISLRPILMRSRCGCSDSLRLFLSLFSPIVLFILLVFIFFFHAAPCRWWGPWHPCRTRPSHSFVAHGWPEWFWFCAPCCWQDCKYVWTFAGLSSAWQRSWWNRACGLCDIRS